MFEGGVLAVLQKLRANQLLLTGCWVLYAIASASLLYVIRRFKAPRWSLACVAAVTSVVDVVAPFTYRLPEHQASVLVIPFMLSLTRPWKIFLYVFDRGPLSDLPSLRDHLAMANLPVLPLKCLPDRIQKRMGVYKLNSSRICELVALSAGMLFGAVLLRLYLPEECSQVWRRLVHMLVFVNYAGFIFNGGAALASSLSSIPLITPFNDFWLASSVADWWNYRWDTVVSLTLRMSVFEPVRAGLNRNLRLQRSHATVTAGICTFLASALIHEYAMAAQGQPQTLGYVSAYFLAQPVLMAVEPAVQRTAMAAVDLLRVPIPAKFVQRAVTVGLISLTVYLLWAPVYDPPYGNLNDVSADAVLRMVGLCSVVQHCRHVSETA
jgi:Membrane bound O-acyl transferase family